MEHPMGFRSMVTDIIGLLTATITHVGLSLCTSCIGPDSEDSFDRAVRYGTQDDLFRAHLPLEAPGNPTGRLSVTSTTGNLTRLQVQSASPDAEIQFLSVQRSTQMTHEGIDTTGPVLSTTGSTSTTVSESRRSSTDSAIDPRTGRPTAALPGVLLLIAGCMSPLGAVLIAPVLPQMSQEFAALPGAEFLVPAVLTAPALMIGIIAPFAGSVVDRLGRKRILLWALAIYSVLGLAPLFLDSLQAIVVSRLGVGVMEAAIATCATTLITDYYSGHRRNKYLGLNALFSSIAAAVFLVLGGIIGENGWRAPFWLYLAGIVIAIPIAFVIFEPTSDHIKGEPRKSVPPIQAKHIVLPVITAFLTGVALFSVLVELPYVLVNMGITSSGTIGILASLTSLGTAVGAFSFRWLAVIRVAVLVPVSLATAGLGIVFIWVAQVTGAGAPLAVGGSVISSLAVGVLIPLAIGWGVARLLVEQRGRGVGRLNSGLFVGQFISPIVITTLVVPLGGLEATLGAIGVVMVLLALAFAIVLARRDEPQLTDTKI